MGELSNAIRLVALDFDGVLTDDRVIVSQDGTEAVVCSRADGLGVYLMRTAGLEVLILSGETNPVVAARGRKMGVEVFQGHTDKEPVLREIMETRGLRPEEVVFVGNDVNDLGCLRLAGVSAVPADAHPEAAAAADIVLGRPGGRGAIRELADLVLAARRDQTSAGASL